MCAVAENGTRTVERALTLLALVSEHGPLSLVEAAKRAELPPSTAMRLLRTLEIFGYLRRDSAGAYRPGSRILQLGAAALSRESLIQMSHDGMERLAARTGESVYLSIPGHGGTAFYAAIVEGSHSVRHTSWVGRSFPVRGSASGAALQGEVPRRGYVVVEQGVEPDVTAVAAPIRAGTAVVAALSLVVPSYRMTPELSRRFGEWLVEEATALSTRLTPTLAD
jgi:IclR family transcriptional regulator, acetate operon repressor